ncbi:hypothetical protein [Acinetobacter bereziniae]|uniref:hypothetical protein n=1 Tax=Acinetobacter bereziniae TaxID=106648 RepID=UPI002953BECA|nr:hypothetical protein [Acinetobacter bereziniae]MDV8155671.1 hypothetical protein [Acinetobacter bereziniae]
MLEFLWDCKANILIGLFSFFSSFDFVKLLFVVPIYVFVQRVHNQTQQRSLKSISDEIIKINDFVIEFVIKINKFQIGDTVDEKTINELLILKAKINSHLNYLTENILAFPYGGPLNYACFFLFRRYASKRSKIKSESLDVIYQETILDDTILSLEKKFVNKNNELIVKTNKLQDRDALFNKSHTQIYNIHKKQRLAVLDQESIDKIVNIGAELISHLENNSRKFF